MSLSKSFIWGCIAVVALGVLARVGPEAAAPGMGMWDWVVAVLAVITVRCTIAAARAEIRESQEKAARR